MWRTVLVQVQPCTVVRSCPSAQDRFEESFAGLLLVGSCSGQSAPRDAVLVHRLGVAHVAETNRRTGCEDVPVQSRGVEEQRISLLVVGDAKPAWVVPAGVAGWVIRQVVIDKVRRTGVKAPLSATCCAPAEVVIVI